MSATYNAAKGGLGRAADVAKNVYGDVKKGSTAVGNAIDTVQTDTGNAAKSLGRNAAKAVGGAAGAAGAAVGGATTGAGRAAAKGFNTGVQNVGGDAVDKMQTNIMTPKDDVEGIKQQIAQKQSEIQDLETQLTAATEKTPAKASTGGLGPYARGLAKGLGAPAVASDIDASIKSNVKDVPDTGFNAANIGNTIAPAPQPAPAPTPNFGRGQQAVAPSSVSYNMTPQKTAVAPVAKTTDAKPAAQQSITVGGQKVSPNDPAYAKIMKNAPVTAESIDLAESLWRKMKSKR